MNSTNQSRSTLQFTAKCLAVSLLASCALLGTAYADDMGDGPMGGAMGGGMGSHRGMHHGMGMGGEMNPERAAKMIDHMIARRIPDATPEQKAKLGAIAKAAMTDIQPLRKQLQAARAESMKLLTAATIDRAALEKARANQAGLMQSISARRALAMTDAAEVLTPAQRAKIAERMAKRGQRGQHHPKP